MSDHCLFTGTLHTDCHCPDCDPSYPLDHVGPDGWLEPTNAQALRDAEADDAAREMAADGEDNWLCDTCLSHEEESICDDCWAVLSHRLRRHTFGEHVKHWLTSWLTS